MTAAPASHHDSPPPPRDPEALTWRHLIAVATIVSLVWGTVFGLGFRLFYSAQHAAALEVRVETAEREVASVHIEVAGLALSVYALSTTQQQIISNQQRIIGQLDEIAGNRR